MSFLENKNRRLNKRGFTLIELLVVISIIGLLSTVVLASLNEIRKKATNAKIKQEIGQWVKAINLYRNDYGFYPLEPSKPFLGPEKMVCLGGYDLSCNYEQADTNSLYELVSKYINVSQNPNRKALYTYYGNSVSSYGIYLPGRIVINYVLEGNRVECGNGASMNFQWFINENPGILDDQEIEEMNNGLYTFCDIVFVF
jgi:prepilin-type N-terminal cleavage/methylation domain-containing protein